MKKHFYLLAVIACVLFSCKPDPVVPTVKTIAVTEITEDSAKSGGEITDDGGADVSARGICWSMKQNPTLNDNHTNDGSGIGTFSSNMSDLEDSTTYYIRAYATNIAGTSYGEELSFMTLDIEDNNPEDPDDDDDPDDPNDPDDDDDVEISIPTVATLSVDEITETSAICGGDVVSDGGAEVTARGVCWSVNPNPTIADFHTEDGNGLGTYQSVLTDLTDNTAYYVRAYAANSEGVAYGDAVSFTTLKIVSAPEVKTVSVTEVLQYTAVVTGEVVSDGGAEVTSRGFVWNRCHIEDDSPIEDYNVEVGAGTGTFTYTLSGLLPNTEYWVYAYAVNSEGRTTGEHHYFTTQDDGTINGYEYVDLGLPSGLKWAAHNVGASSSTEIGNIYAWGEIVTKTEYVESNCTTYQLNMEDISGNPEYDAARANWGMSWRMPTKEEFEELLNNCTWEWEVRDGVGGKKVTGPNGNHIFMPITGYQYGTSFYMQDFGYYWTSTPITNYENYSYDFFFDMELNLSMGFDDRCYGQPVRAVSN